jgi:hypothetical protein
MKLNLRKSIIIVVILLLALIDTAEDNDKKFPKIIVHGDVHGELNGFQENLRQAGIINKNNNWIGENAIFIQIGDVINKCSYSVETYHFLQQLQKQAREKGGVVIRLLGNHEVELLETCDNKISSCEADFAEAQKLVEEMRRDIRKDDVLAAYSLGNILFVHGGLTLAVAEDLKERISQEKRVNVDEVTLEDIVKKINEIVKKAILRTNDYTDIIFNQDAENNGEIGIFWAKYKKHIYHDEDRPVGIQQIVGHNKQSDIVHPPGTLNLINVDVGLCKEGKKKSAGKHAYLVIEDGKIKSVTEDEKGAWLTKELSESDLPVNADI